mgnify:FL=1
MKPKVLEGQTWRRMRDGYEPKYILTTLDGQSFIQRQYDTRYIEMWKALRAAGVSVSKLWIDREKEFMLLPDYKADGSEFYGKGKSINLSQNSPEQRPRREIDRIFLHLSDANNFPKLETKMDEIIAQANARNIQLPFDDPMELLVHPDESWEFMILDLWGAKKEQDI